MRRTPPYVLLLLASCSLLAATQQPASPPEVHIPGAALPAVLDRVESFESLTALAVSPDLERVAVAYLLSEKPERSSLLIHEIDVAEATSVELPGRIRDLLFAVDQSVIYGLQHKSAKKREGDSYLVVYEPEQRKLRRVVRLPASARALDHWTVGRSLLIASRNEIRTLHLPDLRSGPLFRVPGNNLAITAVAGGNLVLVGQEDGLILVNLTDPPGRFEMPIRGSVRSPGPIVAVASSPDGSEALARLADGRLFAVSFDPLRLAERGSALALASLEGRDEVPSKAEPAEAAAPAPISEPPQTAPRELVEATTAPRAVDAPAEAVGAAASTVGSVSTGVEREPSEPQPPATATETPGGAEVPPAQPAAADRPASAPQPKAPQPQQPTGAREQRAADSTATTGRAPAPERPSREAAPAPTSPTAAAATVSTPESDETTEVGADEATPPAPGEGAPASEAAAVATAKAPQLQGRIVGPAAREVVSVVVLGPDNILREAARIRPSANGRWQAERLEPGRYRVQLDAGGGRVLLSDPPFLLLEITPDASATAPDIRVIRAL